MSLFGQRTYFSATCDLRPVNVAGTRPKKQADSDPVTRTDECAIMGTRLTNGKFGGGLLGL